MFTAISQFFSCICILKLLGVTFPWQATSIFIHVLKMSIKRKNLNCVSSKRQHPSQLQNLSYYFTEYCNNTSIHGLKFLGERGRSVIEKIWWLVLLTISLYFCILLITKIYNKWEKSPVVVTFATSQTPIWKIPFPSVTICPQVKAQRKLYNFTTHFLRRLNDTYDDDDEQQSAEFAYMSLVCPSPLEFMVGNEYIEYIEEASLDFLLAVAPQLDDILVDSTWLGDTLDSEDFKRIITSDGVCYTFNLLHRDELFTEAMDNYKNFELGNATAPAWSLENGYDKNAEFSTYPRRTLLSGADGGMELLLKVHNDDMDPMCDDSLQGYKVILQHPSQLPSGNQQYFRVPLDQDVVATVKPNMMTTSDDLKDYDPEDRQCYFVKEKNLTFFKTYNQQNCLIECLANFTLEHCGCVGFHMPRKNSTLICGPDSKSCMLEANVAFLAKEVYIKMKDSRTTTKRNKKNRKMKMKEQDMDCNCLPSCTSLEFDIETSQSDWDWRDMVTLMKATEVMEGLHISRLKIFFKDMQFITSERNQLYGTTDFWANCGGLLGLFTGFSFISIVEIVYFVTLRFICNLKNFGRHYWSGAEELVAKKDTLQNNGTETTDLTIYP